MNSIDLSRLLAPDVDRDRLERIRRRLPENAPADWRTVAALGAMALGSRRVIGIGGGQGAGKSTLAALLAQALCHAGRDAVACSLDDFYLTRHARRRLAGAVHPLLATRGVPGTHDVDLACRTIDRLVSGAPVRVPRFDKGRDDRLPRRAWPLVADVQTVVFEGWCLGVGPQPAVQLETPLNALEAEEDIDGVWRAFVNDACRSYAPLWALVDWWIYLEVPGMSSVRRWRADQERDLPGERRMSEAELTRFVAHYERLTLWLRSYFPNRANWRLSLDENHRVVSAGAMQPTSAA